MGKSTGQTDTSYIAKTRVDQEDRTFKVAGSIAPMPYGRSTRLATKQAARHKSNKSQVSQSIRALPTSDQKQVRSERVLSAGSVTVARPEGLFERS